MNAKICNFAELRSAAFSNNGCKIGIVKVEQKSVIDKNAEGTENIFEQKENRTIGRYEKRLPAFIAGRRAVPCVS